MKAPVLGGTRSGTGECCVCVRVLNETKGGKKHVLRTLVTAYSNLIVLKWQYRKLPEWPTPCHADERAVP